MSKLKQNGKNEKGPLDRIRVLDITQWYSGPYATLLLSGLGAEVIKISSPKIGDPVANAPPFAGAEGVSFKKLDEDDIGLAYLKRNRGKKSITLNLKDERGVSLFYDLVKRSDVIVENFRFGVTKRLGIDYEAVKRFNPEIIYCSITGYGNNGPDKELKAYDTMIQAASGLMSITGNTNEAPLKAGSAISDGISGTFAAMSIISAVFNKFRTGKGDFIDVAMSDCLFSLVFDEPLDCYRTLGVPERQGNRITRFSPFNSYKSKDQWIVIGAATDKDWKNILNVIGRNDLQEHVDFSRIEWRLENNSVIDQLISDWCESRKSNEISMLLNQNEIPNSIVMNIDEILERQQTLERNMVERIQHPSKGELPFAHAAAFPIKFSQAKTGYLSAAPSLGEHTDEILSEILELDEGQIFEMRKNGII